MALLGRDTSVTGPFPKGVLLLETLLGTEALGRPYKFDLSLLSKEPDLDPNDVLGKPLAVGIQLGTGEERFFHGIATKFLKRGTTQLHTRYAAVLRSRLELFNFTSDCRIFNDPAQNALDIVKTVLAARGLTDVESGSITDHPYRAREFCVQYRESDLNFVQRLLEEEGIYYFFKHEQAKHTLVLADSITAHEKVAGYESILYSPKERKVAGAEEHFWRMEVHKSLYPGRHTILSGYDPTELRPKQPRFGEEPSAEPAPGAQFENYDHPGRLFAAKEAQQEALVRTQAAKVHHTTIEVEGNTMGVGVGDLVSLRSGLAGGEFSPFWREEDWGKQYLVTAAAYGLSIDQYETGDVAKSDEPFKAKYQLLDSHTQFRPQRTARKPQMRGPQTALVVGPPGEEIWTDKFGRVMVQFDWDRLGERNEKSSCWVRVAQSWAGAEWGMQFLPRIGEEVVVAFLAGDPDRPIIRGHIYNKDHLPPYDLPKNKTQSGIKTRSTKGGTASNYNEIRFEDKKGQEELHMQAERDMSTLIKQCQAMNVGTDRIVLVGRDETNHVKQNRSLWVEANDSVVIGGTHDKTVTGAVTQIYGDDHSRKVDGEQEFFEEKNKDEHVKLAHKLTTDKKFQLNQGATCMTFKGSNVTVDSAGTITMTAGGATVCFDKTGKATFDSPTGIKLVCGASSLTILPGGIAIASPNVTAAAGAGSTMALGEALVAMNSKTVTIVADGVCTIKGTSALKLQEAEGVKGKKSQLPPPEKGEASTTSGASSNKSGGATKPKAGAVASGAPAAVGPKDAGTTPAKTPAKQDAPKPSLEGEFKPEKCKCGDEVSLVAQSKNISDGETATFDIRGSDGAAVERAAGKLASATATVAWKAKGRPGEKDSFDASAGIAKCSSKNKLEIYKYPDHGPATLTFNCSSGSFGWTGKFDIALKNREVLVTVKIKLLNRQGARPARSADPLPSAGPPVSSADKVALKEKVESYYRGKWSLHRKGCKRGNACDCPKVLGCCFFNVKVIVNFVESGEHHVVNLFQGQARADSANWARIPTRPNTYAHETGHLLGFYDEYTGGAIGIPPRWKREEPTHVMHSGNVVPGEYFWDFRDWVRRQLGEEWVCIAH